MLTPLTSLSVTIPNVFNCTLARFEALNSTGNVTNWNNKPTSNRIIPISNNLANSNIKPKIIKNEGSAPANNDYVDAPSEAPIDEMPEYDIPTSDPYENYDKEVSLSDNDLPF